MKIAVSDAIRILKTDSYSMVVEKGKLCCDDCYWIYFIRTMYTLVGVGPVIGLEYNGPDCINVCQGCALETTMSTGTTQLLYVATDASAVPQQINSFFDLACVQMAG